MTNDFLTRVQALESRQREEPPCMRHLVVFTPAGGCSAVQLQGVRECEALGLPMLTRCADETNAAFEQRVKAAIKYPARSGVWAIEFF